MDITKFRFSNGTPPVGAQWSPKCLCITGHYFEVLFTPGTTTEEFFIKPAAGETATCRCPNKHGYHFSEYEDIFSFGPHCKGFDAESVVKVTR